METMPHITPATSIPATSTIGAAANTIGVTGTHIAGIQPFADINGLRTSGIFPRGKEPSIRTLREWTKRRRIPFHRLGHFVYYDIAEVAAHIRQKLLVPARG
jgi:hypothetical protein